MNSSSTKPNRPPLWIPLLIGIALTVVSMVFRLDQLFENALFDAETGHWALDGNQVERLIYRLSPVPSFIFFGGGLIIAVGSIWVESWRRWRRKGLCLALAMLLGPGLVVNGIFKEFYGRPRPKQVAAYGGSMEFCPAWVVGEPRKAKSFPCGHASIGFYFLVGYFICYNSSRRAARRWLVFGLVFGAVVGLTRMAKGGHWFTDVIWAGVFVYYTSYLSAWICGLFRAGEDSVAQVE